MGTWLGFGVGLGEGSTLGPGLGLGLRLRFGVRVGARLSGVGYWLFSGLGWATPARGRPLAYTYDCILRHTYRLRVVALYLLADYLLADYLLAYYLVPSARGSPLLTS